MQGKLPLKSKAKSLLLVADCQGDRVQPFLITLLSELLSQMYGGYHGYIDPGKAAIAKKNKIKIQCFWYVWVLFQVTRANLLCTCEIRSQFCALI